MAETFPYIGSLDVVHKGQDPKVDQMLIRSFGLNTTMARAYLGTNQDTFTHATSEKVLLDTESYDLGANFASNKYVAPFSGYYYIGWSAYAVPVGGLQTPTTILAIAKIDNTTEYYGSFNAVAAGGYGISNGHIVIYLAATSYVELWAAVYNAAASGDCRINAGAGVTFMEIYMVAKS